MPPLFGLTLVAPERQVYQGRVRSLVAPGREGYFGVLANHAPMVAELAIGELKIEDEEGETVYFAVAGGFLEVTIEDVTIIADAAEPAADIDVARAKAAEARARDRLSLLDSDLDHARATAALTRAMNRLRVAARVG